MRHSLTRRLLLGTTSSMAATAAVPAAAATNSRADDELIRVCLRFAEEELEHWYRYVVAPAETADDLDWPTNWDVVHWITATPARTPEGWHAKALACTAWDRSIYDDEPEGRDGCSPLLAALLRDIVAPSRDAIVSRLRSKYGPLPKGYTAAGIWLGYPEV